MLLVGAAVAHAPLLGARNRARCVYPSVMGAGLRATRTLLDNYSGPCSSTRPDAGPRLLPLGPLRRRGGGLAGGAADGGGFPGGRRGPSTRRWEQTRPGGPADHTRRTSTTAAQADAVQGRGRAGLRGRALRGGLQRANTLGAPRQGGRRAAAEVLGFVSGVTREEERRAFFRRGSCGCGLFRLDGHWCLCGEEAFAGREAAGLGREPHLEHRGAALALAVDVEPPPEAAVGRPALRGPARSPNRGSRVGRARRWRLVEGVEARGRPRSPRRPEGAGAPRGVREVGPALQSRRAVRWRRCRG